MLLVGCAGSGTSGAGPEQSAPTASPSASSTDAAPGVDGAGALRMTMELAPTVALRAQVLPPHIVTSTSGPTATEVAARLGGQITVAAGPTGDPAMRFPRFSEAEAAPTAAVTVTGASSSWMNPGDVGFRFGADVVLDARSRGSATDNGDNLVQRGLQDDASQFKLQVDGRQPSCTFQGSEGTVAVAADLRIRPEVWYRLQCARRDDELVVAVAPITSDGTLGEVRQKIATGDVGSILFPATTPLSVGGKVRGPSDLVNASDQFNGVIARAFVGPS